MTKFRLSYNDDKVIFGPDNFWDAKYTLHIRWKPLIFKWKKDFKEITLDFSNGLSFIRTVSNYHGYNAFTFTIFGFSATFGHN